MSGFPLRIHFFPQTRRMVCMDITTNFMHCRSKQGGSPFGLKVAEEPPGGGC
jgi:hypothetical protein